MSISYNFPPSCQHCQTLLPEIEDLKKKVALLEKRPSGVSKDELIKLQQRCREFEKHVLGHIIKFSKMMQVHTKNLTKKRKRLNSDAGEKYLRPFNENMDELFKEVEALEQLLQRISAGWNRRRGLDI